MSYGMDGWCKEPNSAVDGSNCTKNARNDEDRTTGDFISKQDTLDALARKAKEELADINHYYLEGFQTAVKVVDGMPAAPAQSTVGQVRVEGQSTKLIDRAAAIDALGERPMVWTGSDYELGARNQYDADVLALETVPPVDAVPVVRCRDCKWFNELGCAIRIIDESDKPKETDFCSFGERKDGDS